MLLSRALVVAAVFAVARPAQAQFTIGAGAGIGTGSRGGDAVGRHASAFVEVRVPLLTGVRADAMVLDAPTGTGKLSLALNAVMTLPIPVVTPYVLGGWGKYGMGSDSAAREGWNYGAGVRTSLGIGLFAEYRRHQRVARDLITIGVTF